MNDRSKYLIGCVGGLALGLAVCHVPLSNAQNGPRVDEGLPPTFRVGNSFMLSLDMQAPRGWDIHREVVVVRVWGEWVEIDQGKAEPIWFRPASFPHYFQSN